MSLLGGRGRGTQAASLVMGVEIRGCRAGWGRSGTQTTAGRPTAEGRARTPYGLASTYQARPRHIPSDRRLTPVRGSTQPPPPLSRDSGLFPPSLLFPGSAGAPLGPDFFRFFTSDMFGGPEAKLGRTLHFQGAGRGHPNLRWKPWW